MSFCENKKIILNSREAFLKFRIVDCGSKLSCPQDKMIKKFDFKTSLFDVLRGKFINCFDVPIDGNYF